MTPRFDPKRTLEIDDAKGYRDGMWFALFEAMRDVARDQLADLGRLEVEEWMRQCRLDQTDGGWIRRYAEQIREYWQISEYGWQRLSPGMVTGTGFMEYEPGPLQITGWSPQSEPEAEFRARVHTAADEHVNKVLAAHPWRQPKRYRDPMRDMRWLVKFQVLDQSWLEVTAAHEEAVAPDAVRKAVRRLAREMGLRLRTEEGPPDK
jgi:hypothetical protein